MLQQKGQARGGKHGGMNAHYQVLGPSALNEKLTCAVVGIGVLSEISFLGKVQEPFAEVIITPPELTENDGFPVKKVQKTCVQKTTDRLIEGGRARNPVVCIRATALALLCLPLPLQHFTLLQVSSLVLTRLGCSHLHVSL